MTQLLIAQPELLTVLADPATLAARAGQGASSGASCRPVFAPRLTPIRADATGCAGSSRPQELGITWRMLLGVTDAERFSLEMTALGRGRAGGGLAHGARRRPAEVYGVPRDRRGRMITAAIVGIGKFGGRELTTGSDLDLFVVYGDGVAGSMMTRTDGRGEAVEAHVFYDRAVEALGSILGDITAAGVVFPVDLRLRPGSKGSGFASSLDAVGRYYREWADPWERQTLTRARLVGGDPRVGRAVRRVIRDLLYGPEAPPPDLKEMRALRHRMERELGKETPGRLHVKFGRGGLVDVEFITQALVMLHGARHPAIRRANTIHAIAAIRRAGLLSAGRRGRARRALSLPAAGLGRAAALRRAPVRHARAGRPHSRPHRQEPRLSFAQGVPRGLPPPHGLGPRALRPDRPRALSAAGSAFNLTSSVRNVGAVVAVASTTKFICSRTRRRSRT